MTRKLAARQEVFPIRGAFKISRETRTQQPVVLVEITDGDVVGRAECVPYKRYGESMDGVVIRRPVELGDTVMSGVSSFNAGTVLMTVADVETMIIKAGRIFRPSELTGSGVR